MTELLLLIAIGGLCLLLGYTVGTYGNKVKNPQPHFLADEEYYVFYPHGKACALTREAVGEGILRAERLKIK